MSFILVIFNIFIFYLKDTAQITGGSLLTTPGKSVAVVLGSNHACEVALFDKLRHEYKMHPSHSYYYEKYMNELAKIQTIVLKKYRELNKAFKEHSVQNTTVYPTILLWQQWRREAIDKETQCSVRVPCANTRYTAKQNFISIKLELMQENNQFLSWQLIFGKIFQPL